MIVAEINSNIQVRLGHPPSELLSLAEQHNAVRSRLALRTQAIGFSDQNQVVNSASFTPSERTYNLSGLLDVAGVEAWIERKLGSSDFYELIEVVNRAQLERARMENRRACAFYGDDTGQRYVTFAFDVDGITEYRLWYDPQATTAVAPGAVSSLPGDLNILVELEAASDCIGLIISKLTRNSENEEELKLLQAKVGGWKTLQDEFKSQIPLWERQYEQWLYRSRGSQVSGNLPRKIKRGLFV